jgi:hypothetical protein
MYLLIFTVYYVLPEYIFTTSSRTIIADDTVLPGRLSGGSAIYSVETEYYNLTFACRLRAVCVPLLYVENVYTKLHDFYYWYCRVAV